MTCGVEPLSATFMPESVRAGGRFPRDLAPSVKENFIPPETCTASEEYWPLFMSFINIQTSTAAATYSRHPHLGQGVSLLELSRYVHLNAVSAGIADGPLEYPWPRYRYCVGANRPPAWLKVESLHEYFDKDIKEARNRYRGFVDAVFGKEMESPLEEVFAS